MTGKPKWSTPVLGPVDPASIYERRVTISNDDGIEDGTTPALSNTGTTWIGKFFPRGCRGMIEELQIYCKRTGSGTLTLKISSYPRLAASQTVYITPGSTWAWAPILLQQMWNYDSLFIWIEACGADVSWAYDAGANPDAHTSSTSGWRWYDEATRPFIRIVFTGKTSGNLSVSGIVNTIALPASSSRLREASKAVAADTEVEITETNTPGSVDYIEAVVAAATDSQLTVIRIYIEGTLVFQENFDELNALGFTATTPQLSLLDHNIAGQCVMLITKRFEFRGSFSVRAYNATQAQTVSVTALPTLLQ